MHISKNVTFGFGALIAAGILAACGGGGGNALTSSPRIPSASPSAGSAATQTTGTKLTLTFKPGKTTFGKHGFAAHRAAGASRSPKLISGSTTGLQIAITSGTTSTTLYVDTTAAGANCTTNQTTSLETCSLILPTIGTTESIAVTTVDQLPTADTNGRGSGFPVNTNALGVGIASVTPAPGVLTTVNIAVNPVASSMFDCGVQGFGASRVAEEDAYAQYGAYASPPASPPPANRFVVTPGTPATFEWQPIWLDADGNAPSVAQSPQPFVDVNDAPVPITISSSSTHVSVATFQNGTNGESPPPAGPFAQTISLPDMSYTTNGFFFFIYIAYDGSYPTPGATPATITYANNLTAPRPFTSPAATYGFTVAIPIAPVTVVSPGPIASPTLTIPSGGTANLIGYDLLAANGMLINGPYFSIELVEIRVLASLGWAR